MIVRVVMSCVRVAAGISVFGGCELGSGIGLGLGVEIFDLGFAEDARVALASHILLW